MDKATFQNNEVLRLQMIEALKGFLSIALQAADAEEEKNYVISTPTDLARDALRNAERVGIARYRRTLLDLAEVPAEARESLQPNYTGKTPFDEIADIPLSNETKPPTT